MANLKLNNAIAIIALSLLFISTVYALTDYQRAMEIYGEDYETAMELYEDKDCFTEAIRSVKLQWVVVSDIYRVEFFHLPDSSIGYWKEHCHYQRMSIIDLRDMSVVYQKFGRYYPMYKDLIQNEYLFINNWDSPTSNFIEGWYFNEDQPVKVYDEITRGGFHIVSENTIEVELMKEYPDDSYGCSMASRPYDKYQITLTPTGHESKIIELREWPSQCKGYRWLLW